jgi:hypothetical protein
VGILVGEPFRVSGLKVAWTRPVFGRAVSAWVVGEEVETGHGDQQQRMREGSPGDDSAGLKFEFGDADAIFYEEYLLGATIEDIETAVLVPLQVSVSSGVAKGFVFEDLDGYIAEWVIGDIARYVSEGGGGEAGFAVLELDGYGRLVFDGIDDFGVAQGYVDIVVTMPMHQSFGMRGDLNVEDSDRFVCEGQVMTGLGGDFYFRSCGLRG